MKKILILLLLPFALSAQVDIKDVSVQNIAGTDYYVTSDTADGNIVIRLTPVVDQAKLLAAQIVELDRLIDAYNERIDETQTLKKEAQRRKKEIEKIQQGLGASGKGKAAPARVDPTPNPSPHGEGSTTPQKTKATGTKKKKG